MKFEEESNRLVKIQKNGHIVSTETIVYSNKDFLLFGAANFQDTWALIHIPTERAIASCFKSKEELELYFDILVAQTNLKSLLLYSYRFEDVVEEIRYDVEIAYRKFWSLKKGKL